MYAEHFSLREPPFSITPDPRYIFMSERHREALAHLLYGVQEGGGFVQLTGEVGTGKTTLCRCLLEQLPPNVDVALILNPKVTSHELLAAVCDELRIAYPAGTTSVKAFVDGLYGHLLEAHEHGRRTVLIIDEAQDLSAEVLEQVRLLTNLETAREKLLQIILIGQPELIALLDRDDLRQLAQRITARYHLERFTEAETRAYVRHRLHVAGRTRPVFTLEAVRRVHREAGGIPRLINVICDRAMLGAYAADLTHVDRAMVARAAREVRGRRGSTRKAFRWRVVGAGAAVACVAVAGVLFAARPLADPPLVADDTRSAGPADPQMSVAMAVPVTGSPTKPAEATRPALSAFLAQEAPPGDGAAFAAVFTRWSVKDPKIVSRGCEGAPRAGLQCLARTGRWRELRAHDLPAIIELHGPSGARHRAAVVSLEADDVTLDVGGRPVTVQFGEVDPHWRGDFTVLWKRPAVGGPFGPGMRGHDVEWLRGRLAALDGAASEAERPDVYDRALVDRVVRFQQRRGIQADGIVGDETLLHLTIAARESGTPALTSARP